MKNLIIRVLKKFFLIYVVVTITFFIMHSLPNVLVDENEVDDVVRTQIIKSYNLDKSIGERYLIYLKDLSKGNLGKSMRYENRYVKDIIKSNFIVSLELGIRVVIFSFFIGIPLGLLNALNNKISIYLKIITGILISIPSFVIVGFMQFLAIKFFKQILGIKIAISGFNNEAQKIMPVIALSIFMICVIIRILGKKINEELNKEYVEFAISKGFSMKYILRKHIFKNILPTILSSFTPYIVSLITGSFVIESLFGIPGLGRYFSTSIINRDYTMIMGLTIFYTIILIVFLSIMDILILLLDKRILIQEKEEK